MHRDKRILKIKLHDSTHITIVQMLSRFRQKNSLQTSENSIVAIQKWSRKYFHTSLEARKLSVS